MPASSFDLQGAYDWIEYQCNAANVRYSQPYRNYMTVDGLTYFDCSSLLFFGFWLGGGLDVGALGYSTDLDDYRNWRANAWTVQTMEPTLVSLGWVDVRTDMPEEWLPGDVLIHWGNSEGPWHTEMIYSGAPNYMQMGARSSRLAAADQVSIHTLYVPNYYQRILRDPTQPPPTPGPGPGPTPGPSKRMPIWLLKRAKQLNGGDPS